ncbi:MAG: transcriptional regulator [Burkholderiales bacterium]|nr:transcriptional regulator [Burkholderiales bacterium]
MALERIAVITGDVISSKTVATEAWLTQLKSVLNGLGQEPQNWQIYRGDSFQLEIASAETVLEAALLIKATLKTVKGIDVRMGIGIGTKSYAATQVTESNGEAFVYSGEAFESLAKQKMTMAIKSPWPEFDEEINVLLKLALTFMDKWLVNYAEVIRASLLHKTLSQKELGAKMHIAQNTVSDRQSRAHKEEVLAFERLFRKKITQYMGLQD